LTLQPSGFVDFSARAYRLTSGPNVYFAAFGSLAGNELWRTDGTAAGTIQLTDLAPGTNSSSPSNVVRMGDGIYFSAFAPQVNQELFRLPLTDPGDWVAEPFGQGCRQSAGPIPTLEGQGSAVIGGQLDVVAGNLIPAVPVAFYFSAEYGRIELGPCDLYLATPQFLAVAASNPAGQATLSLQVPNQPSLAGKGVWLQGLVVDPGGSFLGLAALTPALEVRVAP
jgi:ELWxxDGT repeat protein